MRMTTMRDKLASGLVLAGSDVAAAAVTSALAGPLSVSMSSTMMTVGMACAGAALTGGCMRAMQAARELLEVNRKWLNMPVEKENLAQKEILEPAAGRNAALHGRISASFARGMENALKGCAGASSKRSERQIETLAAGMNS